MIGLLHLGFKETGREKMTDTSKAPELTPHHARMMAIAAREYGHSEAVFSTLNRAADTIESMQAQLISPAMAARVLLDNCPNPIFDNLKYRMIGEHSWSREVFDENGDEVTETLSVPWVTVKEIIESALRAIAEQEEV